jgi:hypothetical protein
MAFRVGVYRWSYKGGQFDVSFRPLGVFQCSKYPGEANWNVNASNLLTVNWKGFGCYEFPLSGGSTIDGYAQGNTSNWRKIEFLRDFSLTEQLILGEGFGTAWDFVYDKGSFEVELRCDSYNHFVCPQYPAHSHWTLDDAGEVVSINWGKYGKKETHSIRTLFLFLFNSFLQRRI